MTLPSHYLVEFAPSLKALPQTNLLEEPPGLPILSSLSSSVPVSRHTQHLVPELLTPRLLVPGRQPSQGALDAASLLPTPPLGL